jgi:hypothetical protein
MIVGGNCSLREIQIFQGKNNAITAGLTANESLDPLLEPDYSFLGGHCRVPIMPAVGPEDKNCETDCNDEEDEHEENVKSVNADVLPASFFLLFLKLVRRPPIIRFPKS